MIVSVVSIYDTCLGDQCMSALIPPFLLFCRGTTVVSRAFGTKMWATKA